MSARARRRPPATVATPVAPVLISTAELAKLLGRHPDTVRRWRFDEVGPPYLRDDKTGGVWYDLDDVVRWLQELRVTA